MDARRVVLSEHRVSIAFDLVVAVVTDFATHINTI